MTQAQFEIDELYREIRRRETVADEVAALAGPMAGTDTRELVDRLRAQTKVIYGTDNRADLYDVADPAVLECARGVAAVVDAALVSDNGDGTSTLTHSPFGKMFSLCTSEPFFNQPVVGWCSGFLVASDIVATAGHCLDSGSLGRWRFVFGFRMSDEDNAILTIPNDDIFEGVGIIAREMNAADYALIRLNRVVETRNPLELRKEGVIGLDQKVYVIGHPCGLPAKYAPDAVVRGNSHGKFFTANLDTYGGNSGSPVFNQDNHCVEGILVRGETDFLSNGTCRVSNTCPTTGCRGEDVCRTTVFADKMNGTT